VDAGKRDANQFGSCNAQHTPLRAVRVASYPYELARAFQLVEELHVKGYEVFLNLMASSELAPADWDVLRAWQGKDLLTAIYFADSFGAFIPRDVSRLVTRLREQGYSRIGFHAHNGLQLAFANTLQAIEDGCVCVDASIYGMGRGSGNLPIEILLGYLEKTGDTAYNTVPYLDVIDRFFLHLQRKIGWGYSLESLMGGLANIHPYYVESLFKNPLYTIEEKWNVLQLIKERCPISFSAERLGEALDHRFHTPLSPERAKEQFERLMPELQGIPSADSRPGGGFDLLHAHRGRKFLILATGPSVSQQRDKILAFQKREGCLTIGVNNLQGLYEPDFHAFVSRKRFQQYVKTVSPVSMLLVPSFFGPELVAQEYSGAYKFFDVEAPCEADSPLLVNTTQHCRGLNVAVSAILLAYLMGASEIFAAGLDGYADELNRQFVYFYDENNKTDDKAAASLRYDLLAQELDRISTFLQRQSCTFAIITPTSHRKYYRPLREFA